MERLLVVHCPALLEEDEGGAVRRTFAEVVGAVGDYCPWVVPVRPGVCSLPARGPARYFGGEAALVDLVAAAASAVTPASVGIADGLFAALLAAGDGVVVPPGATAAFLDPLPVAVLGRDDLATLLARLGVRTLGAFAALPEADVVGRFGADGVRCHRVAGGRSGELEGLRIPVRLDGADGPGDAATVADADRPAQPGFWGGASEADTRAAACLAAVQSVVGPEGVVVPRLQGGRGPAERARFVTWTADGARPSRGAADDAPWPGRVPPPAPALVHPVPLPAEVVDARDGPVRVSGRGLLTGAPDRLSVAGGRWTPVTAWAGPWPCHERWWARSVRRSARLQAVTGPAAHLLVAERGAWWVEATYG